MERGGQGQIEALGEDVVHDQVVETLKKRRQLLRYPLAQSVEIGRNFAPLQPRADLRDLGMLGIHLRDADEFGPRRERLGLAPPGDDGDRVAGLEEDSHVRLDHGLHAADDGRGGVVQDGGVSVFHAAPFFSTGQRLSWRTLSNWWQSQAVISSRSISQRSRSARSRRCPASMTSA